MSTIRLQVLRAFPAWRRKEEMKPGEVFGLEWADLWKEVGGAFFVVGSPKDWPDFSGARLTFLIKNKFLCNPDDEGSHE